MDLVLEEKHVLHAVRSMIMFGFHTANTCAGQNMVQGGLFNILGAKAVIDVHFNVTDVSTKVARKPIEFWTQSSAAKAISEIFDLTVASARKKFGKDSKSWELRQNEVEKFFLESMRSLIGQTYHFTKRKNIGHNSNSKDPKTGKVTGGNTPKIRSCVRRIDRINRMMAAA